MRYFVAMIVSLFVSSPFVSAQPKLPTEDDYYKLHRFTLPEGEVLEGGARLAGQPPAGERCPRRITRARGEPAQVALDALAGRQMESEGELGEADREALGESNRQRLGDELGGAIDQECQHPCGAAVVSEEENGRGDWI